MVYSTFPWRRLAREGLAQKRVRTFRWLHTAEMLMRRMKYQDTWLLEQLNFGNAQAFDQWTRREMQRRPALDVLIAIPGASLATGRWLQQEGGLMICDRGSSHIEYQDRIVLEEYRRWGVAMEFASARETACEMEIFDAADAITVRQPLQRNRL